MPRKNVVLTKEWPYHVTARVNNREDFPGDLKYVWKVLSSELYLQTLVRGIRVHALVLMPNHFHLLISTPTFSITDSMREVMSSVTCIINAKNHRSGHLFGGRYRWSVITNPLYYAHALKYVYRNPVKAGLCHAVADYSFSTYGGLLGKSYLPIAITPPAFGLDRLLPNEMERLDIWLNQPHRAEENDAIKNALKRKNFKLPVKRSYKKNIKLSSVF